MARAVRDADIAKLGELFLEYERLDRKRTDEGLSISELERWADLRGWLEALRPPSPESERRSSVRIPTRLNCSFLSFGALEKALVTDMSRTGVFIHTSSPLAIGTELELTIRVQGSPVELSVPGVVVATSSGADRGQAGMGVRFLREMPEVVHQIDELYERELRRMSGSPGKTGRSSQ